MRTKVSLLLLIFASAASCLELKIQLDSDSIVYPQWISGTIEVKNNGSSIKSISMEETQPDIFLSQDTTVKLSKVTDFGPDSPVSLEPGQSAIWCFMADVPEGYFKSKSKGPQKISLTVRQFEAEVKSKNFILFLPSVISEKELMLASMKDLVSQLGPDEKRALDEATRAISFSKKMPGQVDPRIVFWKYRLRHAAFMKDLKQMPICENCFRMPVGLYWSNLLWDWCRMFYWDSPRCSENEVRIQTMLRSRFGSLDKEPNYTNANTKVRTEVGSFVVSHRQAKMLRGGGLWK